MSPLCTMIPYKSYFSFVFWSSKPYRGKSIGESIFSLNISFTLKRCNVSINIGGRCEKSYCFVNNC